MIDRPNAAQYNSYFVLICITAAFMNKNKAAMRRSTGVSFKGPRRRLSLALPIDVITIITIFVFFPGNGRARAAKSNLSAVVWSGGRGERGLSGGDEKTDSVLRDARR